MSNGYMPDVEPGTRILVADMTHGEATFVSYGPASMACGPNHISYPNMRIAFVDFDRYGRRGVWEKDIRELPAQVMSMGEPARWEYA